MTQYFYDVEVSASFFECGFLPIDTPQDVIDYYIQQDMAGMSLEDKAILRRDIGFVFFVVHENYDKDAKNEILSAFKEFILKFAQVLIGYNSKRYDDLMVDFIVAYLEDMKALDTPDTITLIKNLSDTIISTKSESPRYVIPYFKNVDTVYTPHDVMSMHNLHKQRVSLKHLCIVLKHYRIEDLPFNHTDHVPESELLRVIDYNFNDIIALRSVYFHDFEEVSSRYLASTEWNIPLSKTLSASRANLASRYIRKEYAIRANTTEYRIKNLRTFRRLIQYADIIDPRISFNSKELSDFLTSLKSKSIRVGDKFGESVIFNNVRYDIKLGGLHSKDRPDMFMDTDKYYYMDGDVDSFYPFVILNLLICPKHLDPDIFLPLFREIVMERIACKRNDDPRASILKIVINAIFGKFNDENDMLLDVLATYKTTINGQLYLLRWIEDLYYGGIKALSANTDGVVSAIPKDKLDMYYAISKNWQEYFNFTLSFKEYTKYVRLNVNSYMAVDTKGKIKTKGLAFTDTPQLDKGFDTPIVAKALQAYFTKNIPIADFIRGHRDIYDFTLTQKAGGKYKMFYSEFDEEEGYQTNYLQKTNRFYASTKGHNVFKLDTESKKLFAYNKGNKLTPFNDAIIKKDFGEYNINYAFYIAKTTHIVESIHHMVTKEIKGTKKKTGIAGSLFDNEETEHNPNCHSSC